MDASYDDALQRARQAQQQVNRARVERDEAVYEAAERGASRRQIAAALGIALGSAHNYVVAAKERRAESAQ